MKKLFLVCLIFLAQTGLSQTENFWQILAEVHFKNEEDPAGYTIERPVFSKNLKNYHGKKVTLKGYIIPLEESGGKGKFMLSALPFNLCYFCGAAGPETVVEVETKESIKFSSKQILMEGILSLNDKDADHHIYILKSATLTTKL
jgi:hypothetical protein